MHIPDNYLSPSTCITMGAIMLPVWKRCITKVKETIGRKKMPSLGVCAAFSFLIMMFNVPIPNGTSGHAVGGTLIAILLGPYAATLCITIALFIQAIFFGDGGILAFGANCFNMAFVMPFTGYAVYTLLKGKFQNKKIGNYLSPAVGAYCGIVLASLCAAVEFGIQPILFKDAAGLPLYCPYSLSVSIPSMLIPHATIIGLLEAAVTAGVYSYIKKVSPDTIYKGENIKTRPIYVLIAIMILLTPLGLLASGTAWGEWGTDEIKSTFGFIPKGMKNGFNFNSFMSDYSLKGFSNITGYIISAVLGTAIIIIIFKLVKGKNYKQNS